MQDCSGINKVNLQMCYLPRDTTWSRWEKWKSTFNPSWSEKRRPYNFSIKLKVERVTSPLNMHRSLRLYNSVHKIVTLLVISINNSFLIKQFIRFTRVELGWGSRCRNLSLNCFRFILVADLPWTQRELDPQILHSQSSSQYSRQHSNQRSN